MVPRVQGDFGRVAGQVVVAHPSGASRLRLSARTFASFHSRAFLAIHGSQASAARIPGTLFAAIDVPVPVQHITTPKSASPEATATPTTRANSGQLPLLSTWRSPTSRR